MPVPIEGRYRQIFAQLRFASEIRFKIVVTTLMLVAALPAIAAGNSAALVATWVQDETGPVLVHARRYKFNADGSYEFTFTSRSRGSTDEKLLAREVGTFRVEGERLLISPKSGKPRAFPWRVEKDRYVGNLQLVMVLPDGNLDIYYPQ